MGAHLEDARDAQHGEVAVVAPRVEHEAEAEEPGRAGSSRLELGDRSREAVGGPVRDAERHAHDPHEPREQQVRDREAVPRGVVEEVVAAAAEVHEDHEHQGQAPERVQRLHPARPSGREQVGRRRRVGRAPGHQQGRVHRGGGGQPQLARRAGLLPAQVEEAARGQQQQVQEEQQQGRGSGERGGGGVCVDGRSAGGAVVGYADSVASELAGEG